MDVIQEELESRKAEIRKGMEILFKANMKITDWDVPEADDNKVARIIVNILQDALDEIKADIATGKYDYY